MSHLTVLEGDNLVLSSERYINRELSWLKFNSRVLEEAKNPRNPLLERLKFLAIFESNLDEFYMVRVSGLIEQEEAGVTDLTPDGMSPSEQLALIAEVAHKLRKEAGKLFQDRLLEELAQNGITIKQYTELSPRQKTDMRKFFENEVFPVCTPLAMHPSPTFPFISSRSLNLAVELDDADGEMRLARVKVPTVFPRAIRISKRGHEYVLLEDIIANNLETFFPGIAIKGSYRFRVVRDADIEIQQLEAADLFAMMEQTIRMRRFGAPVLLEIESTMPKAVEEFLCKNLELEREDIFRVDDLIGMDVLWELSAIDKAALRFPPHHPFVSEKLSNRDALFETVSARDVAVHFPFDSFRCVEEFVAAAANDPQVIGIKQTLYRVGTESPIVESLLDAANNGKQVAAMVELKARFDESNNLVWARALERAGVHVTYGFHEMKTHCKLCLIVRREGRKIRMYAFVGTGNFNPTTARIYTDIGIFTSDPEITQDISELFNFLTGFSRQQVFRKLLVAPLNLREGIIERIERETELHKKHGNGRIIFKLNALVDTEVIDALYEASNAGVQIDLICRGVCCLRPGVSGLSENIRVISVVGRFLEHSRVYYFDNAGVPDVLIGSADLMRRNLDRRIETLVGVRSDEIIGYLRDVVLDSYLRDNVQAWDLMPDGKYIRRQPAKGHEPHDAQRHLMSHPASKLLK